MSWKKRKQEQVNPRRTHIDDPLAVIPMVPENVEQKRDSRGLLHLRLHVPLKGIQKCAADWLGYDFTRKVELDELGSLYYALADGRRTLRDIAGGLAGKGGRSRQELEEHVVRFTRTLMVKNLILLKVTDENRVRDA